jgi:SNF2 family DNA or RNA helicase
MREREQTRRAEQEARRKKLHANLDFLGYGDDEDQGRIIVNDAAMETQGFLYVNEHIARRIKKHQIEGVRFLWNQIITEDKVLQGCLLAHTMGLGKTMQVYVPSKYCQ